MPKILEDEKIYRAVMQVVAERGYSGATTKQMADAADVSEVTLFRKYDSKQNLVKQAISSIISQTDLASAAQYTGDLNADLARVVQSYLDSAVRHGDFIFALFSELSRHPELIDSLDEPLNIFIAIGHLISRYQEDGKLHKEHPMHTLAVLLGPLMYSAMLVKMIPNSQLPPIDPSDHVAHFLAGRRT